MTGGVTTKVCQRGEGGLGTRDQRTPLIEPSELGTKKPSTTEVRRSCRLNCGKEPVGRSSPSATTIGTDVDTRPIVLEWCIVRTLVRAIGQHRA